MIDPSLVFVAPYDSVLKALQVIDSASLQIALIVDDQKRLLGTLTDGDIRRGILHGESLDTPVERLMNRQFRSVLSSEDKIEVLKMMRRDGLHHIPVLDVNGRVEQLMLLDEILIPSNFSNVVVIMAGGKGTRLRPYTENCPKPMLPVDGKPMLEILLEQCIENGFSNFYFSLNYLKEQIIDYFGNGDAWGVSIEYLVEDEPLGTAGSLQLLPPNLNEPFLVMNGDVLTRLDLSHLLNFHIEHKASATLCVREHVTNVPFGVVQTNGIELAGFVEKPSYSHLVNAGVYVINPEILPLLPSCQFMDMPSLLDRAQKSGRLVSVCPIHEYWIDVGRPESLRQAHQEWSSASR